MRLAALKQKVAKFPQKEGINELGKKKKKKKQFGEVGKKKMKKLVTWNFFLLVTSKLSFSANNIL